MRGLVELTYSRYRGLLRERERESQREKGIRRTRERGGENGMRRLSLVELTYSQNLST